MPTSVIFQLRPLAEATLPAYLGRAAHAAILARIAEHDSALATRLHADQGIKPITISSILGVEERGGGRAMVTPRQTYGLRVTMLCDTLEQLAARWVREPWDTMQLGDLAWRVERITVDPALHPWAGSESYESLAAATLRRIGAAPRHWAIEFLSPVTFRSGAVNHPIPLPDLVFRSLLEKWNAFSPLPLPRDLHDAIAGLVVSSFDMRSVAIPAKGGALQIGAIGQCSYHALGDNDAWLAGIDLLARFACYCGVGAGTARGFGHARLLGAQGRPAATLRRASAPVIAK